MKRSNADAYKNFGPPGKKQNTGDKISKSSLIDKTDEDIESETDEDIEFENDETPDNTESEDEEKGRKTAKRLDLFKSQEPSASELEEEKKISEDIKPIRKKHKDDPEVTASKLREINYSWSKEYSNIKQKDKGDEKKTGKKVTWAIGLKDYDGKANSLAEIPLSKRIAYAKSTLNQERS